MAKRTHSVASKIPTGIERIEDFARRPKRPAWKIKLTFFPRAGKSHFKVIPHRPETWASLPGLEVTEPEPPLESAFSSEAASSS